MTRRSEEYIFHFSTKNVLTSVLVIIWDRKSNWQISFLKRDMKWAIIEHCQIIAVFFNFNSKKKHLSFSAALYMIIAICFLWEELSNQQRSSLCSASPRTLFRNNPNGHKALAVKKWQCTAHRELYVKNTANEREEKKERISPAQAFNTRVRLKLWVPDRHLFTWLIVCSSLASLS